MVTRQNNLCSFVRLLKFHFWWLVRGILLMEWGLLHDFFGNFSTWSERYYFCVEGSTWGGHEVTFLTCGENSHTRWLFHGGGDNLTWGHTRWTWGDFSHMWWEWLCKVTFVWWWGQLNMRAHEMGARWLFSRMVRMAMWGDFCVVVGTTQHQGHVRWFSPCMVRMAMWGEICKVTSCPCETCDLYTFGSHFLGVKSPHMESPDLHARWT